MISEELVASGGTQVREADIPESSPKATVTQEFRVSVVLCSFLDSEGLLREAAGQQQFLEMSSGDSL